MRAFLYYLLSLTVLSCSLYESESRKFLRQQGLEFKAQGGLSLKDHQKKHCLWKAEHKPFVNTPEFSQLENDFAHIIMYNHFFTQNHKSVQCEFHKIKPDSFQTEDWHLIIEITNDLKSSLD